MKLLMISIALFLSTFSTSAFAKDGEVSPVVLQSFQSQFTTATQVDWSVSKNFYKAQFVLNNQHVVAFYNNEGTLIGLTRNITSVQLPVSLQADLKKDYDQYWISDLFELNNEEGTSYYVTLENADNKVVLKGSTVSHWSTYQKTKK
jgi:hypothetical protein